MAFVFGQYLALSVFASYFLIITGLFYIVGASIYATPGFKHLLKGKNARRGKANLHLVLATASFLYTWYYMVQYLQGSFDQYRAPLTDNYFQANRLHVITSWLVETSLFEEAWATVCIGWSNWWWSEQLCLYTAGAWTAFLFFEGRKRRIAHLWAYMLLGQFVAISVASNLFYVAVSLSPPTSKEEDKTPDNSIAPARLYVPIVLSLTAIVASPNTSKSTFLPNLLVMHASLLLPLLLPTFSFERKIPSVSFPIFYSLIAFVSMICRLRSTKVPYHHDLNRSNPPEYISWRGIAYHHWETLHSHPARSSIGWDVIWTTASFLVWEIMKPGDRKWTIGLPCILTLLWGVGFAAPAVWALYS